MFSATANFVGSGVLGAAGVATLTKVKHRRELLFAALPMLFAVHQFMEGFVWLGLDGILSPSVAHDMGAAFMLYAQGLLPFLLPLSVLLFEPNAKSRSRMLPTPARCRQSAKQSVEQSHSSSLIPVEILTPICLDKLFVRLKIRSIRDFKRREGRLRTQSRWQSHSWAVATRINPYSACCSIHTSRRQQTFQWGGKFVLGSWRILLRESAADTCMWLGRRGY